MLFLLFLKEKIPKRTIESFTQDDYTRVLLNVGNRPDEKEKSEGKKVESGKNDLWALPNPLTPDGQLKVRVTEYKFKGFFSVDSR